MTVNFLTFRNSITSELLQSLNKIGKKKFSKPFHEDDTSFKHLKRIRFFENVTVFEKAFQFTCILRQKLYFPEKPFQERRELLFGKRFFLFQEFEGKTSGVLAKTF